MKRFFAIITVCLLAFGFTNAQAVSGKQKIYLPHKGDFAIGFDLKPILKYAGNLFNGNMNNTLEDLGGEPISNNLNGWDNSIAPDVSIMGKYMLNHKWAVRANVGLLIGSNISNEYIRDDKNYALDPLNETKLIDQKKSRKNGMSAMLGAEYRKGTKRIQGVFGFGALIGFKNTTTVYNYANQITSINQQPSNAFNTTTNNGYRITKQKGTSDIFYGATGSAGIEWFVAPKIALGAEVNLSIYGISGGQQYTESEGWNNAKQEVETRYDLKSPGNAYFQFGTDNIGGSLYMSFYF